MITPPRIGQAVQKVRGGSNVHRVASVEDDGPFGVRVRMVCDQGWDVSVLVAVSAPDRSTVACRRCFPS